jgi:uncharacterized membrane protein YdjX (TVP38/TMEM64 family)
MSSQAPAKPAANRRLLLLRIGAVLFAVGISITLYLLRDRIHQLEALGYPGIFLVTLLSNATIILPVPGVLFTSVMGAVLNPFGVALAAATGAALGELSGYLAGFGGQVVVERSKSYNRITGWVERYGQWAVMILAFIPNPFFDIAGMAAGVLKMPLWKFLLFCWIGSLGKMLLFAFGGATIKGIFNL